MKIIRLVRMPKCPDPDARNSIELPVGATSPAPDDAAPTSIRRDHGGNLDAAIASFGGRPDEWIDLSTGINRMAFPMPELTSLIWQRLPTRSDFDRLIVQARRTYATDAAVLPVAGAQSAIQLIPRLFPQGRAAVLGPTYNEHRASLEAQGWSVREVARLDDLAGADLAIVVNPNNPDGRLHQKDALLDLATRVGRLVVDESFIDATSELSLAPVADDRRLIVLRSFGKFYGLAGARLGFVIGGGEDVARLAELAGPWNVSGAAIEIGRIALADTHWAAETAARLRSDAHRMDKLAERAGFGLVGGTVLFRLYDCADASAIQARLAESGVWSRIFPWSKGFVRLGLPGPEGEWRQLEAAFAGLRS